MAGARPSSRAQCRQPRTLLRASLDGTCGSGGAEGAQGRLRARATSSFAFGSRNWLVTSLQQPPRCCVQCGGGARRDRTGHVPPPRRVFLAPALGLCCLVPQGHRPWELSDRRRGCSRSHRSAAAFLTPRWDAHEMRARLCEVTRRISEAAWGSEVAQVPPGGPRPRSRASWAACGVPSTGLVS